MRKGGVFFWIDADVVTRSKCDEKLLKKYIEGTFLSYMGRQGFNVCTSFIGFNEHPDRERFCNAYEDIYLSKRVFEIPEWHDGFVFDWVRKETGVASRNLSPDAKGICNVFDKVIPFAHHKKGNLKMEK
ncbi:MAG: hypothetical protein GWN62_06875 [Aliifodinibius sp.]|nr:hypothetical protein [Fodinibius sp.]